MNGILEMEGFKDTFRYLYNGTTDSASGMIMGSDSSNLNASMSDSGSGLGGVCSTGNGTGSDILIVSSGGRSENGRLDSEFRWEWSGLGGVCSSLNGASSDVFIVSQVGMSGSGLGGVCRSSSDVLIVSSDSGTRFIRSLHSYNNYA